MQIEVYRNLHNGKLSIRDAQTKHVLGHACRVYLHDSKFVVSQAGRERVVRERCKNVHAVVRGVLDKVGVFQSYRGRDITPYLDEYSIFNDGGETPALKRLYEIKYNPYKFTHFWREDIDEPVYEAGLVRIMPESIHAVRITQ